MPTSTVTEKTEAATGGRIKVGLAFAAIYILWGSSFLAIRVAVQIVPPWFAAGVRFFTAGVILYVFSRLRGERKPSMIQWRSLAVLGALMFVATYGALFWAEQYVPSGITSVLEATLPLITMGLEVFVLRQQPFRPQMLGAVLLGFIGVFSMLFRSGSQSFGIGPCLVIIGGGCAWSLGSVLTRDLPLPSSRVLTAGAQMMLGGGALLIISLVSGELHPFPHLTAKAFWAILYLIVAASIVSFTAYVWLLGRMPATVVSSHAYVNPVVALALGYFVGGEQVTMRTLIGAFLVIASVALTLTRSSPSAECDSAG
jgi:drug/metabolite transporter (DMT)-like permease